MVVAEFSSILGLIRLSVTVIVWPVNLDAGAGLVAVSIHPRASDVDVAMVLSLEAVRGVVPSTPAVSENATKQERDYLTK